MPDENVNTVSADMPDGFALVASLIDRPNGTHIDFGSVANNNLVEFSFLPHPEYSKHVCMVPDDYAAFLCAFTPPIYALAEEFRIAHLKATTSPLDELNNPSDKPEGEKRIDGKTPIFDQATLSRQEQADKDREAAKERQLQSQKIAQETTNNREAEQMEATGAKPPAGEDAEDGLAVNTDAPVTPQSAIVVDQSALTDNPNEEPSEDEMANADSAGSAIDGLRQLTRAELTESLTVVEGEELSTLFYNVVGSKPHHKSKPETLRERILEQVHPEEPQAE